VRPMVNGPVPASIVVRSRAPTIFNRDLHRRQAPRGHPGDVAKVMVPSSRAGLDEDGWAMVESVDRSMCR